MIIDEKEYCKVISKNLRRLSIEKDITQQDIAKFLNVSKASVSLWFNGKSTPRMDKIDALCKYMGVRRSDIMEPQDGKLQTAVSAEDVALLSAFHAAPENIRKAVLMMLQIDNIGGD